MRISTIKFKAIHSIKPKRTSPNSFHQVTHPTFVQFHVCSKLCRIFSIIHRCPYITNSLNKNFSIVSIRLHVMHRVSRRQRMLLVYTLDFYRMFVNVIEQVYIKISKSISKVNQSIKFSVVYFLCNHV